MEHDHSDHAHEDHLARSKPAATAKTDVARDPGRSSRSALLDKPDHAVASGLVQHDAHGGGGGKGAGHSARAAPPAPPAPPGRDTAKKAKQNQQQSAGKPEVAPHFLMPLPMASDNPHWVGTFLSKYGVFAVMFDQMVLAGAFFAGTEDNARNFIRPKPKDQRKRLEADLKKMRHAWDAAAAIRGGQAALKQQWERWHQVWLYIPVTVDPDSITIADCQDIIEELRKKMKYKTSEKPPQRWIKGQSGYWCGAGATEIFKRITGCKIEGDGKNWDGAMNQAIKQKRLRYEERKVPAPDPDHKQDDPLHKLPTGSVLVWQTGTPPMGQKFGHVCIVVSGQWVSDHITPPEQQGTGRPNAVFTPVTPNDSK